ncbi:xenotropic and polytropic retrovirus receptor 1 [Nematocida sp. LUAm3]|nr:xenotropic and polytropic retrovirus receptor 1 [Nematocida sp. LUAm3]KAI5174761.1 xenotropic and polytropic retrovirus receptor 1 [Nematocida sp. LUAm2]KAI5177828.1 xenotropic and polytropic retrovirus receptor 1 [Nematocida sp. LUAm1]
MKFSKTLKEKQVQEWRKKYIAYEQLKNMMDVPDEVFFAAINKEIEKVEEFYKILERGAERGLFNIVELFSEEEDPNIKELIESPHTQRLINRIGSIPRQQRNFPEREKKKRQKAVESRVLEYYMVLNKILKYKEMNIVGFRKILKKYDKHNETAYGPDVMQKIVGKETFYNTYINELMQFTRVLHKKITPIRNRDRAKKLVVDLTQADDAGDASSFFSGAMCTGGLIALLSTLEKEFSFWYCVLGIVDGMFLIFCVLFYICRRHFINYMLILDLNLKPKLKISKCFLLICISFLFHGVSALCKIPVFYICCISAIMAFLPVNVLYKRIRYYMLNSLLGVFLYSIQGPVRFQHFFIADHLLSSRPLLLWSLRMAYENPNHIAVTSIYTIPIAIRISQCMRRHFEQRKTHVYFHLCNMCKYFVMLVSDISNILSAYVPFTLCLGLLSISQTFGFFWDIWVDWMLYNRPKVFQKWFYVFSVAVNAGCRGLIVGFFIVSRNIPSMEKYNNSVSLALCFLELFRRLLWGVIRIEVEHLNNCDRLKAINGPLNDLFYLENVDN